MMHGLVDTTPRLGRFTRLVSGLVHHKPVVNNTELMQDARLNTGFFVDLTDSRLLRRFTFFNVPLGHGPQQISPAAGFCDERCVLVVGVQHQSPSRGLVGSGQLMVLTLVPPSRLRTAKPTGRRGHIAMVMLPSLIMPATCFSDSAPERNVDVDRLSALDNRT